MKPTEPALLAACFMPVSRLTYSSTMKIEAICSSETLDFSKLHGFTTHTTELFTAIVVRTSNPTYSDLFVSFHNRKYKLCSYLIRDNHS
jgi:hypothetical protein